MRAVAGTGLLHRSRALLHRRLGSTLAGGKVYGSAAEACADVHAGAKLLVGGFGLSGCAVMPWQHRDAECHARALSRPSRPPPAACRRTSSAPSATSASAS
jgi:hypothetical protein